MNRPIYLYVRSLLQLLVLTYYIYQCDIIIITNQMQGGHKIKKFTHNRMKACIERGEEDKENRVLPDPNKKFSVELPSKHSQSSASDPHKSIFNEQISVTLNPRTHDKEQISLDIQSLTHLLARPRRDSLPLRELLTQEMQEVKSIEVRLLLNRMLDKLAKEGQGEEAEHSTSMNSEKDSHVLITESMVRPIIEKELEILHRNYQMLQQRYVTGKRIKQAPHEDKLKMLARMKEIERAQQQEIAEISQL